jgi:hypothetical protein
MEHIKPDGAAGSMASAVSLPKRRQRPHPVRQPATVGQLSVAREAVRNFLLKELKAREVRVSKIGPAAGDPPGWYAEAEILVADLGMKMLNLPLTQQVFERQLCAVDLNCDMEVKSYELLEPRDR